MSTSITLNYVNSEPNISSAATPRYLDWTQRTPDIQEKIKQTFNTLSTDTRSGWGLYNGSDNYSMCGVDEHSLMKKVIQQAPTTQKNFYALDIGAGNFQWVDGLGSYIEEQTDLPKDIKVHIIGIRGEKYLENKIAETDRCKTYKLGAFKIEELFTSFKEQDLDIENKVDLIVSRWCFRHLVDPVGTFSQAYNLLRPKSGFLFIDGFMFLHENDNLKTNFNKKMTQLFLDTTAPFLQYPFNEGRSLNRFILKRPDETPCQLPMSYLKAEGLYNCQVASQRITRFKREPQETDEEKFYQSHVSMPFVRGNKNLYEWLKQSSIFYEECMVWQPLQNKDVPQGVPSLHQAIQQGEHDKIKEYLNRGDEIDASDSEGSTALHIAIRKGAYDVFQLLISQGAHLELSNGKGYTPLHEAAISDTEGRFLNALLDAGVEGQAKDNFDFELTIKTPLEYATEAKNVKAIELLTEAERKISK